MAGFIEKSAFLRQTWALLMRNAVLHVHLLNWLLLTLAEPMGNIDIFTNFSNSVRIVSKN
jgi:hypothetical protein